MNEELVQKIWQKEGLAENIREHCRTVEKAALELANRLTQKGVKVNLDFVKYGALLHDIGRARDHSVRQGITGYEILQNYSVPEEIRKIAKYHVGAGITKEETLALKIEPVQDLLPVTVEEKIVSYGDNLVAGQKILSFQETLHAFEQKFGLKSGTVERLKLEHRELESFVTRDEMHELEKKAIEKGLSIEKLMENAGKEIARITNEFFPVIRRNVVCFAGPGNNGGDALVAARYFKSLGAKVSIVLLVQPQTWEAKMNLKRAQNDGIEIKDLESTSGEIVVDGIFGTGVRGEIGEPFASAIRKLNEFEIKVAIDVPSGLNPDSGEEKNVVVNTDLVICLGRFKKGLIGKFQLGRVQIADIGV
ncbi:TPA: NAD(P)H-hydrate epimerase [archaeon]|uniref:NAD(P)H-hydrate epimerase n=1 Tax=Candidatus Naiadarchaeum limnaeum TaxID=2756139 RepID=A0A832X615_9ARCH|nr:NAD(P)H-hydrate epimerase [Candidatus Naiadarchaeales archaeon SRR2090153.bin1042]HIK00395.1 NAD(P)H-hydrate epimerase [Candidatus Naiadarchaeum limnaeum]